MEFYEQASVLRAISLGSGAMIMGQRVVIQASQAEKNRAAKVAKQQAAEMLSGNGPLKIYVGGLVDTLSTITEAELMQLFEWVLGGIDNTGRLARFCLWTSTRTHIRPRTKATHLFTTDRRVMLGTPSWP